MEETERPEEKEQRALLKVIDQEANRLDHFVEGLVDLAQIEAGEITVRRNWSCGSILVVNATPEYKLVSPFADTLFFNSNIPRKQAESECTVDHASGLPIALFAGRTNAFASRTYIQGLVTKS